MRILQTVGILAGVLCLALLGACSSGSSGSTTATITLVGASCSPTSITSLQTSQCTASVSGTGNFSSTVIWSASGGGTINAASGVFTAATVPFSTQVTITATSTQDTTKTGSTTITVAAAGTVTSVTATCNPTSVANWTIDSLYCCGERYRQFQSQRYVVGQPQHRNHQSDNGSLQQHHRWFLHHHSDLAARFHEGRNGPSHRDGLGEQQPAHRGGRRSGGGYAVRQWSVRHRCGLHTRNHHLPDHRSRSGRYRIDWPATARQHACGRRRT